MNLSISLSVSLTLVSSISYPPSQLISQPNNKVAMLLLDTQVPQVQARVATTTAVMERTSQHPLFILPPLLLIHPHHLAVTTVLFHQI